jgi:hypothetical protein
MTLPSKDMSTLGIRWRWFLAILSAVEVLLLVGKAKRDVLWSYPTAFDQSNFLLKAYALYEQTSHEHFWTVLFSGFLMEVPTGALLNPIAVVAMHALGANRLACLSVNIVAFLLAQFAISFAVKKQTRSTPATLFAIGLLLAAGFPFFWAGGVLDFRLDFVSVCLFAALLAAVISSNFLNERRGTMWVAVVAVALLTTRFITTVYIIGVGAIAGAWLVWQIWRSRGTHEARMIDQVACNRRRLIHLAAVGFFLSCTVGPLLIHNRHEIYRYYGIGHFIGPEKTIREYEQGISDLKSHLAYYPRSVFQSHLGSPLLALGASGLGVMLLLHLTGLRHKNIGEPYPCAMDSVGWIVLGAFLAVPCMVLTANIAKSPVVGAIMVPALLIGAALAFSKLAHGIGRPRFVFFIAIVVFAGGLAVFAANTARRDVHGANPVHARAVNQLYLALVRQVDAQSMSEPKIAFLTTNEAFLSSALNVWVFETQGRMINALDVLGGSVFSVTPEQIMAGLDRADIIVLPDHPGYGGYPFMKSIQQYFELISAYCAENTVAVAKVRLADRTFTICTKIRIRPEGISGDWITDKGITIRLPSNIRLKDSLITLTTRIPNNAGYGSITPKDSVSLTSGDMAPVYLTSESVAAGETLVTKFRVPDISANTPSLLEVRFDRFFVPRDLGINDDVRKLSVGFVSLTIELPRTMSKSLP